jgi:hypothetical protein
LRSPASADSRCNRSSKGPTSRSFRARHCRGNGRSPAPPAACYGKLWLRNADIYELPVMVALLKILSIKRPLDTTAFTASDIDFRINGEDVYLDRMVFDGDAISLKGTGEVNFDRRVHLNFYTLVGSESRRIPIVWPLLADASRRILMIEITGTLDEPVTTRHVLPGLNSTLQQLFSEELGGSPPNSPSGPPRASDRRSIFPR